MIADGYAQAGGQPIVHKERDDRLPAPELGQEGNQGQSVEGGHEGDGSPAAALRAGLGLAMAASGLMQGLGPALAAFAAVDERGPTGASTGWPHWIGCSGHGGPTPD